MRKHNNTHTIISIRKGQRYSGYRKKTCYKNKDQYIVDAAIAASTVTRTTAIVTPSSTTMIEEEIQRISLQRLTWCTRTIVAMLTRILGIPVNRKRVQRILER